MSQRRPLLTNFSEYTLAASVDELATAIALGPVEGLPEITSPDEYIPMVLRDATVNREVVHVTAVDTGSNTVTVLRGQEGTTAQSWNAQAYIYVTLTSEAAADLQAYAQYQAEDARDKAEQWAEEITDVEVEPGKFSASHHRTKAQAAQTAAELARDAAEGFKNDAGDRADWAAGYAGDAQDWAIKTDGEVVPGEYSAKKHALDASATLEDAVKKAQNLSDVADPATSLANLGGAAKAANLSDLIDPVAALTNLGGRPFFHVVDRKAEGGSGGNLNGDGNWYTRHLNTILHNSIAGAYLDNDYIHLPAGTYFLLAEAPGCGVDSHRIVLEDLTNGWRLMEGTSERSPGGTTTTTWSKLGGVFTLAAAETEIAVKHRCQTSNANGRGYPMGAGPETYTTVKVWRLS